MHFSYAPTGFGSFWLADVVTLEVAEAALVVGALSVVERPGVAVDDCVSLRSTETTR